MKLAKRGKHSVTGADEETRRIVSEMLSDLEQHGMDSVRKYSGQFDDWNPKSFELTKREIDEATELVSPQVIADTEYCQNNVRRFARAQLATLQGLEVEIRPGVILGHRHIPVNAVGSYIPGGRYPMFGSAQMSIIPAKETRVRTVVACTPPIRPTGFFSATVHAIKQAGPIASFCSAEFRRLR